MLIISDRIRNVFEENSIPGDKDRKPLNRVFKLAYITRPPIPINNFRASVAIFFTLPSLAYLAKKKNPPIVEYRPLLSRRGGILIGSTFKR